MGLYMKLAIERASEPASKSKALALERLHFARSFLVKPDVTRDSSLNKQKQIDSYVSRCFFRIDGTNKAKELRRTREASKARESGTPINSSLYCFGKALKDLGSHMHLVRRLVEDALRKQWKVNYVDK